MGGDLIGDDALAHVVLVRQAQMFFGRDVTEHGGAGLGRQRGANSRGDVVIAGRNVRHQRAEHVKRRFVTDFPFLLNVHLDQVHRNVARPFDHDLAAVLPSLQG